MNLQRRPALFAFYALAVVVLQFQLTKRKSSPQVQSGTEIVNMMKYCALLLVFSEMVAVTNSFTTTSYNRFKLSSLAEKISEPMSIDPNFEAHLANFLKVGSAEERPTPELAADLRKRFKSIEGITQQRR